MDDREKLKIIDDFLGFNMFGMGGITADTVLKDGFLDCEEGDTDDSKDNNN